MFVPALFKPAILHLLPFIGSFPEHECDDGALRNMNVKAYCKTDTKLFEVLSDSITSKAFLLQLIFEKNKIVCHGNLAAPRGFFINLSIALAVPDRHFNSTDTIDSAVIRRIYEFKTGFPAGLDLSKFSHSKSDNATFTRRQRGDEKCHLLFIGLEETKSMHDVIDANIASGEVFNRGTADITITAN